MLTRLEIDAALVARVGKLLAWAGLSVTITPGTPLAATNEPIASALEELGVNPATRSAVADGDLAKLDDSMQGQVVDLAELRAMEMAESTWSANPLRRRWDDYEEDFGRYSAATISATIERKRKEYAARYGGGRGPKAGVRASGVTHPFDASQYFPA